MSRNAAHWTVLPIVHVLSHGVPICTDPLQRSDCLTLRGRFALDGKTVFCTSDPVDCMNCLVEEARRP